MTAVLERESIYNPQHSEGVSVKENSSIFDRIQYLKKHFKEEGLPQNWADLPGTGFMINKQLNLLRESDKEKWLGQTHRDLKGFILEYLAQGLVFPINYTIDSEDHLIDKNYGNKKVADIVSSEERNGSIKEAVEKKLQPFMAKASDGSIAVIDSPSGWSGLRQEDGRPITFPDSQTYIFQKKGKDIVGFTIRTDFKDVEHREFIRRLTGENLSENASLEDYVRRGVALIDAKENTEFKEIKDVVKLMQDTRRDVYESFLAYEDRSWNEIYKDLGRGDELWNYDEATTGMVQEFEDFVLDNELSEEEIKEALAVTVLRIAKFLKKDIKGLSSERIIYPTNQSYNYQELPQVFYGAVLKEVQKLPGCAGGGSSTSIIVEDGITPRNGELSVEAAKNDPNLCRCGNLEPHFHCPGKLENNDCKEPIVVGKGITACPKCGEGKTC